MPKIKIYGTHTCVYCHMLTEYLKSKSVTFEEVFIDTEPEEMQASIDTCGSMGVPCTHITLDDGTEKRVLGFDRSKFDEILNLG